VSVLIVFIPVALVPVVRVVCSVGVWLVQLAMLAVCTMMLAA
jgi:hypothetical protein